MAKIIRRPDRAEGGITPEEKTRMDAHAQRWIDNAMRTDPIVPDRIYAAISALYAAADLKQPRIVIVPSPLVMALAGGFAAAIWHLRKNGRYAATRDATYAATLAATYAATRDATDAATRTATYDATRAATRDATRAATYDATDAATYDLTKFFLSCANNWWRMYHGGNMWSFLDCYLTAARDILGLRLPVHAKYSAWEQCAMEGGFRIMHDEFCMVSDFPEILLKDDQNRPHCDFGPSHRWRDGWSLYHVHGVRVTEQIVMHPETLTIAQIESETNAEVRRVMIERFGTERYLMDSGAALIASDHVGELYRKNVKDDEPLVMVKVRNSTPEPDGSVRDYFLRVPPNMTTPQQAIAWTFGLDSKQYRPAVET